MKYLSPLHYLLMSMIGLPSIGFKFGIIGLLGMSGVTIFFVFRSYIFYQKRAKENRYSFVDGIAEDLPDMSPIHILMFLIISAPISFGIIGLNRAIWLGLGIVYFSYAIYFYGFRRKG